MMDAEWRVLAVNAAELSLARTLASGQAFRWRRNAHDEWTGTIGNRLFTLRRAGASLQYHVPSPSEEDRAVLKDYLRLDTGLCELCRRWGEADANFKRKAVESTGVRLLKQDPTEALIAFICSSNNNISRISLMLHRLCRRFGVLVARHGGEEFHSFPPLERLAQEDCERELRALGFGYRARYVYQTARTIVEERGGVAWLHALRDQPYSEAWRELQRLPGVGAKVADCVCLMGLDKLEAVPVDVHIQRIMARDYGVGGVGRTLTRKTYQEIGDFFRSKFGEYAGWAQAVLFAAELQVVKTPSQPSKQRRRTPAKTDRVRAKRPKLA